MTMTMTMTMTDAAGHLASEISFARAGPRKIELGDDVDSEYIATVVVIADF